VVTLPLPAWAVDATRPGAVRGPALTPFDHAIVSRLSAARALEHIRVLSEDIGPRIGGTASEPLPTEATVAFSLWGSEEQGLIGSRYHVARLPQSERERLTGVFENDMVATSWDPATRYWLMSFTGQNNVITRAVIDSARRLGYEPQVFPVTQRGASDHQSFQEIGIDSANFSWRGEESPALLEPPYHSPEDTIAESISLERLQVSLELIGTATYATGGPPI
jgi:aminopeptidase YwaD